MWATGICGSLPGAGGMLRWVPGCDVGRSLVVFLHAARGKRRAAILTFIGGLSRMLPGLKAASGYGDICLFPSSLEGILVTMMIIKYEG